MLGDFLNTILWLLFGYAYPAFECFKTVEMHSASNDRLQFWCQYWIIVALITVMDRISGRLLSWFPMYDELKLALFVYLWHPKTEGAHQLYEIFFRTYIRKYQTDIDRNLREFRLRAGDIAVINWQSFAGYAKNMFQAMLQYLLQQSFLSNNVTQSGKDHPHRQAIPPGVSPKTHHR